MGRDRRTIDSEGNEALVTAALDALKVDIIDPAGVTIEDLETTLDAIETLLGGTAKVKIWDGTDQLDIVTRAISEPASGIVMYGRWFHPTPDSFVEMPVAAYTDDLDKKGSWVIPVTPMTAELKEGVKVTDGTDTLSIAGDGDTISGLKGIIAYGIRYHGTDRTYPLPVAQSGDSKAGKGAAVIPVTPMTGGLEEGVFTRGFIPETQITQVAAAVSITNTTWTTLRGYSIPADTTFWLTDLFASEDTQNTSVEHIIRVIFAGSVVYISRIMSGNGLKKSFHTPIKITTAGTITLQILQWSGGALNYTGGFHGFNTVNSELD